MIKCHYAGMRIKKRQKAGWPDEEDAGHGEDSCDRNSEFQ